MATDTKIKRQVKKALDGRTFRWLAMKVSIHESDLSKKLSGDKLFTVAEINKINVVLKTTISL